MPVFRPRQPGRRREEPRHVEPPATAEPAPYDPHAPQPEAAQGTPWQWDAQQPGAAQTGARPAVSEPAAGPAYEGEPGHGPGPAYGAEPTPGPEFAAAPDPGHGENGTAPGSWRPLVVGVPLPDFEPCPPSGLSYRPDTVCDGWSTSALDLRLASVRGYQHRHDGRPREDDAAAAWDSGTGTVVFAVADGVSDARQPHVGAQLACRSAVDEMLIQVRGAGAGYVADWEKLLSTVHWQLVEQARRILRDPDAGPRETAGLLATTLVAGTATPAPEGLIVHLVAVGDSGAWQIKHERFYILLGGKSAGADGLVSSAVEPLPYVPAGLRPFCFCLEPGTVLLVGTDGFGDALGDGTGAVARLFLDRLRGVVAPLGFAHLLDFSRETFDDDRTLLAIWPRGEAGGGPR